MAHFSKIFKNVLIFPSFLCCFLASCEAKESTERRDYPDYEEFHIALDDFYNQAESSYYVYVYRPDCSDCVPVKAKVLNYVDSYKEGKEDIKLYFIEVHHIETDEGKAERAKFKEKPADFKSTQKQINELVSEMNGATSLEETYFIGTPTLYFVKNSALFDVFVGQSKIKQKL